MQVTTSVAIMHVLRLYCNYADSTLWYSYVRDLSVAIMHVTVSVAIMQLEVSAALIQVTVSGSNMWVTIFIVFMQMGVSIAIMHVVLSVVHNYFYCKIQFTVPVIAKQVTLSYHFYILFSNWHPFLIKLTGKHLKSLYHVFMLPLL